ncbi:MAG: cyclopropane-fatty-acyl-phospholipid synthase [Deltaproteobacteria bacterium]|nr:cyclopropane-fatty-acyl-phospholipid synthase [Deltaproteobacteria bacterium]
MKRGRAHATNRAMFHQSPSPQPSPVRGLIDRIMPQLPTRKTEAESIVRELFGHAGVEIGGTNPWDITVHDPRFYERLLRDASIGFGESYMEGWWDVPALDVLMDRLVRSNIKQKIQGSWRLKALTVKALILNLQAKTRSGPSVEAHYDIGNDLYTRMLDERMVYTCGYWKDAKTLTEAQEAKLDLVARKVGLKPGMRVLDLGCGWGGMASWAAEKYGCSVLGVTLSKDQVQLGNELWGPNGKKLDVELRLCDYRDVQGKFDRVVSIGMMEHVGPKNHRDMMKVIDRCLVDDGVALVHTIGNNRSLTHGTPWIEKYIFPNAVAPSLEQLGRAIGGLFVLEDLHNIGEDYDPTLMAWWENFDRTYAELAHKYDRKFYLMWKFYLLAAAGFARARDGQLYQMVLTKTGRAKPDYVHAR